VGHSLQSNILLNATECSNLLHCHRFVTNRNLEAALAFKSCESENRGVLRNETTLRKGGCRYTHQKRAEIPRRADSNRKPLLSERVDEACRFPQPLCHRRYAPAPPSARRGDRSWLLWGQDSRCACRGGAEEGPLLYPTSQASAKEQNANLVPFLFLPLQLCEVELGHAGD